MRILQLIDTLNAGGAERVAVNFANALVDEVDASFLCATRREGVLKKLLKPEVGYLFLERSSTLDISAIKRLSVFVKHRNISHIHAHATSFFIGTILKILHPKIKLIWHDHYGESEYLKQRPKAVLKFCSKYFNHIFCVNSKLKVWAETNLKTTRVSYLPNFAELDRQSAITQLKGFVNKRIVCLANLRPQKDHITLLKAFKEVNSRFPKWSLHLVGQDFQDDYSKSIRSHIEIENLSNSVFMYGSCSDISAILKQCDIAVLSSKSEGLPLALVEYGLAKLPTIATNVGDCNLVISNENEGKLIAPQNSLALKNAIEVFINNPEKAKLAGEQLNLKVKLHFSKQATIKSIVKVYQSM
ncbi:glycosyltransferase involved in cell wall biosynthesis [Jejuia pallidilutea]|uniref:Glycosyltransferase involved in cell wall biosynthesis n=1 Tax=Jejuia pallidilutea TaxID=504487 RepID=A0A362WY86_9FLAO|nr:glycosyltransferase [Jejuia pallidilutea]PQV47297.1 glycosyltransferase involved in cell wall biosynthesis [Jejuia pallidilutea]